MAKSTFSPVTTIVIMVASSFLGAALTAIAAFALDNMWILGASGLLVVAGVVSIFVVRNLSRKLGG